MHDYFFAELFQTRGTGMLNWGISLQIAFIEFIIFALLLNAFLVVYPRIRPIWPIIAAVFLYAVTWVTDLVNTPTLALKLMLSAGIGFLSYYLFMRLLNAITKKFIHASHPN